MINNGSMESSELLTPEILGEIEGLVSVPLENGESLHVGTSRGQFAKFFHEYADTLGFDGDQAQEFFKKNVDLVFTPIKIRDTALGNKFDTLLGSLVEKGTHLLGRPLGMTAPLRNGRFAISVDLKSIADQIPKYTLTGRKISGYSKQNREERIASLQSAIEAVADHESRHLLQYMVEPEKMAAYRKSSTETKRDLLGFTVSAAASFLSPDLAIVAAPAAFILLGLTAFRNRKEIDIEKDAYATAETAIGLKLSNKPFNFEVRSTK